MKKSKVLLLALGIFLTGCSGEKLVEKEGPLEAGNKLFDQEDYRGAIEKYQEALGEDSNEDIYILISQAYKKLDREKEAKDILVEGYKKLEEAGRIEDLLVDEEKNETRLMELLDTRLGLDPREKTLVRLLYLARQNGEFTKYIDSFDGYGLDFGEMFYSELIDGASFSSFLYRELDPYIKDMEIREEYSSKILNKLDNYYKSAYSEDDYRSFKEKLYKSQNQSGYARLFRKFKDSGRLKKIDGFTVVDGGGKELAYILEEGYLKVLDPKSLDLIDQLPAYEVYESHELMNDYLLTSGEVFDDRDYQDLLLTTIFNKRGVLMDGPGEYHRTIFQFDGSSLEKTQIDWAKYKDLDVTYEDPRVLVRVGPAYRFNFDYKEAVPEYIDLVGTESIALMTTSQISYNPIRDEDMVYDSFSLGNYVFEPVEYGSLHLSFYGLGNGLSLREVSLIDYKDRLVERVN